MPPEANTPATPSDPGAPATPAPADKGAAPAAASPAPSKPNGAARPENLPEQFWDAEAGSPKLDDLLTDYHGLSAFKAERDAMTAALPESPDKYDLSPLDFEKPEGFEVAALDPNDETVGPVIQEFRSWAHEQGYTPEQVRQIVTFQAKAAAAEYRAMIESARQERESLGANGPRRLDALENRLIARLGEKHGNALKGVTFNKTQVEALEKLLDAARQGVPAPNSAGREAGNGQDKGWDIKTPTLRKFATALGYGANR